MEKKSIVLRFKAEPSRASEWMKRAHDFMELARAAPDLSNVDLVLFASSSHQAAELSLKAVHHHLGIDFDGTHQIGVLAQNLDQNGVLIPPDVKAAAALTRYYVNRYPDSGLVVSTSDWQESVQMAADVVAWAESILKPAGPV